MLTLNISYEYYFTISRMATFNAVRKSRIQNTVQLLFFKVEEGLVADTLDNQW